MNIIFSYKQILIFIAFLVSVCCFGVIENVMAQTAQATCTVTLVRPDNTFDVTSQCDGGGCGAKTMTAQLNINSSTIPGLYQSNSRSGGYSCDAHGQNCTDGSAVVEKPCVSSFAIGTYNHTGERAQCQYVSNQYEIRVNNSPLRPNIQYADASVASGTRYGNINFSLGNFSDRNRSWVNTVNMAGENWNSSTLIDLLYVNGKKTDFSIKYNYQCNRAYTWEDWQNASSSDPFYSGGSWAWGCPYAPAPYINNYGPAGQIRNVSSSWQSCNFAYKAAPCWCTQSVCTGTDEDGNCTGWQCVATDCTPYYNGRGRNTYWQYFNGDVPSCSASNSGSATYVSGPTNPNCLAPDKNAIGDQIVFEDPAVNIKSTGSEGINISETQENVRATVKCIKPLSPNETGKADKIGTMFFEDNDINYLKVCSPSPVKDSQAWSVYRGAFGILKTAPVMGSNSMGTINMLNTMIDSNMFYLQAGDTATEKCELYASNNDPDLIGINARIDDFQNDPYWRCNGAFATCSGCGLTGATPCLTGILPVRIENAVDRPRRTEEFYYTPGDYTNPPPGFTKFFWPQMTDVTKQE